MISGRIRMFSGQDHMTGSCNHPGYVDDRSSLVYCRKDQTRSCLCMGRSSSPPSTSTVVPVIKRNPSLTIQAMCPDSFFPCPESTAA